MFFENLLFPALQFYLEIIQCKVLGSNRAFYEQNAVQEQQPKTVENPTVSTQQTTIIPPITQQPKNVAESPPIQLDKITDVSVEELSTDRTAEEEQMSISTKTPQEVSSNPESTQLKPVQVQSKEKTNNENSQSNEIDGQQIMSRDVAEEKFITELRDLLLAAKIKQNQNAMPTAPPPVNQRPNVEIVTSIDGDKLKLNQMAPDLYQGTFRGSVFHIFGGKVVDSSGALTESDRANIKLVYEKSIKAMQLGMTEMSGGYSALKDQEAWNPPPGSTINTNFITRRGENAVMTFKYIDQGHFRSTYEGKDFIILNGKLLADESFDEFDRQLIMQTHNNTLLGMRKGLLGMQNGMQRMKNAFAGANGESAEVGVKIDGSAYPEASFDLASGRETLKRMRSLNHGKRISLIDAESKAQPRQPVMVIKDITDIENTFKKSRTYDQIDGSTLAEPVLQKTTFTPHAIIFDDPKTYEEQDKNEQHPAKPNDEYIISIDENFNSKNRYHFHKARPKRVTRPKLSSQAKFRLQSPERYCLFEEQCLKMHNQYRKMHGVPPLIHNEFLAQVAKEWAEHLALKDAFYHRPKNEYGENLYYVDGMPCHAKSAVKAWYDEIELYDYDNPKFSKEVGHFTQLVWKDTREVGTGVAQIGDKVWVCCNYHPPGNYLNKMNDEFVPRPVIKLLKKN